MSGQNLYYPWADIASDAGLVVKVTNTNSGWERRARSSGGFPAPPLGCVWHHAASSTSTSDEACVNYQVRGNPDNPVGNGTLGRNGDFWPIAGGASNCAGKSERDIKFSRGTCPISQGNVYLANWEVNNNGVGEPWSTKLIDAYFALSNAVNAYLGNQPTDIISHALGDGTGYTNRKIDPAKASAVQGSWVPRSVNSSGTWSLPDMKAECQRRAGTSPGPGPGPGPGPSPLPPGDDDEMLLGIYQTNGPALYVCYSGGNKFFITDDGMWDGAIQLCQSNKIPADPYPVQPGFFAAMGMVVGPRPDGTDEWGNYV